MNLILTNKTARLDLVTKSHKAFFGTYFSHYLGYPSAKIHDDIFAITESRDRFSVVLTFRGSGKSTLISMSYAIWAILGIQKKHFVVIVAKTQEQGKKFIDAIKREFETNDILRNDFGNVSEESTPWNSTALTFQRFDAQITAISTDQAMRGIRFKNYRPDLFILDDIEDIASVKTLESRDNLENWFNSDLLPAGDISTKIILVGNNLHEDSLPNRIIEKVNKKQFKAKVIKCPLVDEKGTCAWPSKFPSSIFIEEFKNSFPSDKTWRQEYLLQVIPPEEQIITWDDIHYYDDIESFSDGFKAIGVDLARSKSPGADCSAFVPALVRSAGDEQQFIILPDPVNAQMDFAETKESCLNTIERLGSKSDVKVYVECVSYQDVFRQELILAGARKVARFYPGKMDKRERLYSISGLIKTGKILFPKSGAQTLLEQTVYFGATKHDDLVDALTALVLSVRKETKPISHIGMAYGDLYYIQQVRVDEKMKHDAEVEEEAMNKYMKYSEVMKERYAKLGLRWYGNGDWGPL